MKCLDILRDSVLITSQNQHFRRFATCRLWNQLDFAEYIFMIKLGFSEGLPFNILEHQHLLMKMKQDNFGHRSLNTQIRSEQKIRNIPPTFT